VLKGTKKGVEGRDGSVLADEDVMAPEHKEQVDLLAIQLRALGTVFR
jgi:hypothetical protein